MQDRYAGDTPDFGKYVLLWHIQRETGLRLGVNWYRTRPEEVDRLKNNDGKTRHHAKRPAEFATAAPDIYEKLRRFEKAEYRRIENVEEANILPPGTRFFSEFLSYGLPRSVGAPQIRRDWFNRAYTKLEDCQVVFCDPDTGPAPLSKRAEAHTKVGPKYAYPEEISAHLKSGQSVIIIRFISPHRNRVEQNIQDTFNLLETQYGVPKSKGFAVEFPEGRNSTYFILPAAGHEHVLRRATDVLMENPNRRHLFKLHSPDQSGC